MCTHTIIASVAGLVLALASLLFDAADAQTNPPAPAVQDLASAKPIGTVVTTTGSVTIEHAGAMVIQANVAGQIVQTKVGDIVYLGDVVRTGADGRVGINFADGSSFKLSSNARMALDEFGVRPEWEIQLDLVQSDQRNTYVCRRQYREVRRHEGRYPSRNDGYSGHDSTCRNFG